MFSRDSLEGKRDVSYFFISNEATRPIKQGLQANVCNYFKLDKNAASPNAIGQLDE
jgi:hypothetical protein